MTQRTDTTIEVLDAHKGIVGGLYLPWRRRRLDGVYGLPGYSGVHFPASRAPLPVYLNHAYEQGGIAGYVIERREDEGGLYCTAQLTRHPLINTVWRDILAGEVAWSYDHNGEYTNGDGAITGVWIVGMSLTAFPYWKPDDLSAADYLALCRELVRSGYASGLKPVDLSLMDKPIAEGDI